MEKYQRVIAKIMAFVALGGTPNALAENLNNALSEAEIVSLCEANVQRNMSYQDYCNLCYNACVYLNERGLNVTIDELYAPVYVINYSFIDENLRNQLITNGFVPNDTALLLNDCYSLFGMISTVNHNVYLETLNNKEKVDTEKLIKCGILCFNEKDKSIVNEIENDLTAYINTEKKDCGLNTKLFCQFTNIPNESNYNLEQASIGAEVLVNLTSGAIYYSQISPMHQVDGLPIANDEILNALSAHIHDISSLCQTLENGPKKVLK